MMRTVLAGLFLCALSGPMQAQWVLQDSGVPNSMRGIHALEGGRVAWASGTRGTVIRTVDGGAHWTKCAVPQGAEMLDFRGVQAFDEKVAVVMSSGTGDASRIYRTVDGCGTWTLLAKNEDPKGFWDAIKVTRAVKKGPDAGGWLVGDPTRGRMNIFALPDFFDLKEVSRPLKNVLDSDSANRMDRERLAVDGESVSAFAASNQSLFYEPKAFQGVEGPPAPPAERAKLLMWWGMAWLVTGGSAGARVYEYRLSLSDCIGCEPEWKWQAIPVGNASASSGAFAVWMRDVKHGVIVGGDYTKPDEGQRSAVYTVDGAKWLAPQVPPHGYRSSVAYDSKHKAWITVGTNGTDISTDDGKNWRALKPGAGDAVDADRKWNALSLPFVVGDRGRIGKLRDGVLR